MLLFKKKKIVSNLGISGLTALNYQKKRICVYANDPWGSDSWLDHLISTEDGNDVKTNMSRLYGTILSEHWIRDIQ